MDSYEQSVKDRIQDIIDIKVKGSTRSGGKFHNSDLSLADQKIRIECKHYSSRNTIDIPEEWIDKLISQSKPRGEIGIFSYKNKVGEFIIYNSKDHNYLLNVDYSQNTKDILVMSSTNNDIKVKKQIVEDIVYNDKIVFYYTDNEIIYIIVNFDYFCNKEHIQF